jgi:aspartate/methionine/tyrosine aminotransferase
VNLGQGFPDWTPPPFVTAAGARASTAGGFDQYARSQCHPPLAAALAQKYAAPLGRERIDPDTEIVSSVGASQVLYTTISALCGPGDKVVLLEPAFDIYGPQVHLAGAEAVYVPLVRDGARWRLDMARFREAVGPDTRAVLLNSPHNPLGKVFTRAELEEIAEVVRGSAKCIVIADEVYEHIVFAPNEMVHMASLPGMWDRTVTVSSSGKTFSVTGWKVGWAIGPAELVSAIAGRHQWMAFSVSTVHQEAIAQVLGEAQAPYEGCATYYDWLRDMYTAKRNHLLESLRAAGLDPIEPEGSFFIVADTSRAKVPQEYLDAADSRDYAVCRWLTREIGVAAIPPSAFYAPEDKHLGESYARFAFCKRDESLAEARTRLAKLADKE